MSLLKKKMKGGQWWVDGALVCVYKDGMVWKGDLGLLSSKKQRFFCGSLTGDKGYPMITDLRLGHHLHLQPSAFEKKIFIKHKLKNK